MAKASATITVSLERDISSVTRYYKLQASTASAPAKPTTLTPSGWTTTEPAYTEGSTNSLYITDRTVFTDGTFSYSDVSLSSSYEAAKAAYNRAVEAAKVATNYISDSSSDGFMVHPENDSTTGWKIKDALEMLKSGVSFFKAWVENSIAKVRVGREDAGHTLIDSNGMRVYGGNGTEQLANIGYGEGVSKGGETEIAPYYTFGSRIDPTEIGLPQVIGNYSFVEGYNNAATSIGAHAGGSGCEANAPWSFAFGGDLLANYPTQFVIGNFNEPEDKAFIVGGGLLSDDPEDRANIFTVDWDGNVDAAGTFTQNGKSLFAYEDVTVSVTYAAGTIGSRGATVSLGTTVKTGYTYIGAVITDHRNTSVFSATVVHNRPNNTAHLAVYRATGNAASDLSVTVRKIWVLSSFASS